MRSHVNHKYNNNNNNKNLLLAFQITMDQLDSILQTRLRGPIIGIKDYIVKDYGVVLPFNISQPLFEGIQCLFLAFESSDENEPFFPVLTCSICLEVIHDPNATATDKPNCTHAAVWYNPYPTTCGHLFHLACLGKLMRSWSEDFKNGGWPSRKCPLCRTGAESNHWYRSLAMR